MNSGAEWCGVVKWDGAVKAGAAAGCSRRGEERR